MFNILQFYEAGRPRRIFYLIGSVISGTYTGAAIAPNGSKYFVPSSADKVLKIDINDNVSLIGNSLGTAAEKWASCVLAPNGKIYGIPSNHTRFLEIDPETDTTKFVGNAVPAGPNKYMGGLLGSDGLIYCICANVRFFARFNPNTYELENIGPDYGIVGVKWWGGVLAPNNKMYFTPYNRTKILELDFINLQFAEVGPTMQAGGSRYAGGILYDRQFILAPRSSSFAFTFFDIDTHNITAQVSVNGSFGLTSNNNGMFYTTSGGLKELHGNLKTLKIINGTNGNYSSGILSPNGKIYFAPPSGGRIMVVKSPSAIAPLYDDWHIPSDISTLATSKYNSLYNKL